MNTNKQIKPVLKSCYSDEKEKRITKWNNIFICIVREETINLFEFLRIFKNQMTEWNQRIMLTLMNFLLFICKHDR